MPNTDAVCAKSYIFLSKKEKKIATGRWILHVRQLRKMVRKSQLQICQMTDKEFVNRSYLSPMVPGRAIWLSMNFWAAPLLTFLRAELIT